MVDFPDGWALLLENEPGHNLNVEKYENRRHCVASAQQAQMTEMVKTQHFPLPVIDSKLLIKIENLERLRSVVVHIGPNRIMRLNHSHETQKEWHPVSWISFGGILFLTFNQTRIAEGIGNQELKTRGHEFIYLRA